MTFEDRAADAAAELKGWTPDDPGIEIVERRSRRRTHRRRAALGGAAVVLAVTSTVALWPAGGSQRVIAGAPSTTAPGAGRCRQWADADVIVYMNPGATPESIDAVGARLAHDPRVRSSRYLDDGATFELFKQIFRSSRPEMIGAIRAEDLPTSYQVVLADVAATASLVGDLTAMPGVYTVDSRGPDDRPSGPSGSGACPRGAAEEAVVGLVLGGATTTTAVSATDGRGRVHVRLDIDAVPSCPPTASCVDPTTAPALDGLVVQVLSPTTGAPIAAGADGRLPLVAETYVVQVQASAGPTCPGVLLSDSFRLVVGLDASLRLETVTEPSTLVLAAGAPTPPVPPGTTIRLATLTGRIQLPWSC
ncbi:MAG: permease-like cell division protein FtsX [Acidimicrobiales bacterium]